MRLRTIATSLLLSVAVAVGMEETFSHPDRDALLAAGWAKISTGKSEAPVALAADSLTHPGLKTSAGGRLTLPGVWNNVEVLARDIEPGVEKYVSFLMRVGGLGKLDKQFATLLRLDTGGDKPTNGAGVFLRLNEDGKRYDLGVHKRSNGNEVQTAAPLQGLETGKVYLVVIRLAPGSPQAVEAWVNPDAATFGDNARAPAPALRSEAGRDTPTNWSRLVIDGPDKSVAMTLDEVRTGNDWASVTPREK